MKKPIQLKTTDIARYRTHYSVKQKYKCPICNGSIASGIVALDHSHDTGQVRATLCGTCNRNEGKVKSGAKYMAKADHLVREDYITWLENLVTYLKHHDDNPSGVIHPSFDLETGKQKPKRRKKKR